ncbi:hypothetical protein [Parvularcula oceani]|uniref:hypothetical protein n=1 Tax=Parvularcula oceani TaxID=1247963 RepID=UPI00138E4363|nr:hypothetical protein [Parvularcula oceani]
MIEDFAPSTYNQRAWRNLGMSGGRLTVKEARGFASLPWQQTWLYGVGWGDKESVPSSKLEDDDWYCLEPSKAGPISTGTFELTQRALPRHLYALRWEGDPRAMLGAEYDTTARSVWKVGMSYSPSTRCAALNHAYPPGGHQWLVERSTSRMRLQPIEASDALQAEGELKAGLNNVSQSLGGEFFLATMAELNLVWQQVVTGWYA